MKIEEAIASKIDRHVVNAKNNLDMLRDCDPLEEIFEDADGKGVTHLDYLMRETGQDFSAVYGFEEMFYLSEVDVPNDLVEDIGMATKVIGIVLREFEKFQFALKKKGLASAQEGIMGFEEINERAKPIKLGKVSADIIKRMKQGFTLTVKALPENQKRPGAGMLSDVTVTSLLQTGIECSEEDAGKIVYSFSVREKMSVSSDTHEERSLFYFRTKDFGDGKNLWLNGLDNQAQLSETLMLFDSLEEALNIAYQSSPSTARWASCYFYTVSIEKSSIQLIPRYVVNLTSKKNPTLYLLDGTNLREADPVTVDEVEVAISEVIY